MIYFNNVKDLNTLRNQYKNLLKKYHPDNPGGDTEITKEINKEYDIIFQQFKDKDKDKEKPKSSNVQYDYYDWSEDKILREVLEKIINLNGIEIEIIGNWIWVGGNTKPYKDIFHTAKYRWAKNKKKWYFHTEAFRKKSTKSLSMDQIREYYGSIKIKEEAENRLRDFRGTEFP